MSRLLVDPIDLNKAIKNKDVEVASDQSLMENPLGGAPISLDWLRFAAKDYEISSSISDYLLVPVIIVPVGFPNRNGMGFEMADITSFCPDLGMQYYKTWVGKPTYYEHANQDIKQAHGVVLDMFLRKSSVGNYWKMLAFLAYDRSKYVDRVRRIEKKELSNYSMGAMITGGYSCSSCGRPHGACDHISKAEPHRINVVNGNELAFRVGRKPVGFEISAVEIPAWSIANNENAHLINPDAEYIG